MPYITPTTTPTTTVRRCLFIPSDPLWLAAFNGAISELTKIWNWEDIDGITPQQASEAAQAIFAQYLEGCGVETIGTIFMHGLATAPDGSLPCDGAQYDEADYPALYAVIHANLKDTINHIFFTPEMLGRVPIAAGQGTGSEFILDDIGGAEVATLTVANLPAHHHPIINSGAMLAYTTISPNRADLASGSFWSTPTETGDVGSGTAHNNLPPYSPVYFAMWYR